MLTFEQWRDAKYRGIMPLIPRPAARGPKAVALGPVDRIIPPAKPAGWQRETIREPEYKHVLDGVGYHATITESEQSGRYRLTIEFRVGEDFIAAGSSLPELQAVVDAVLRQRGLIS